MRKKNRYLKALSILLVLCVITQSVPIYAKTPGTGGTITNITGGSSNSSNGASGNQPSAGRNPGEISSTTQAGKNTISQTTVGGASSSGFRSDSQGRNLFYRIGLAKLDNEEFPAYTDPDDMAAAIQEYGKKYYVTTQGAAYYYSGNSTLEEFGVTTDAIGRRTYTANASNAPYIATILNAIYTGNWQLA